MPTCVLDNDAQLRTYLRRKFSEVTTKTASELVLLGTNLFAEKVLPPGYFGSTSQNTYNKL